MAGAQNMPPGGIEELVHTLAGDAELGYWLETIDEGRIPEEEVDAFRDQVWEQVVKDHGLIPEYAALHGLKERVLETAQTQRALVEAARVQT